VNRRFALGAHGLLSWESSMSDRVRGSIARLLCFATLISAAAKASDRNEEPTATAADAGPLTSVTASPVSADAGLTLWGEETVVTATRRPERLRDVPADVTVVNRADIDRSSTETVDALLESVPGFDTFRRSNSIGSDPSSEGVSLRGVGPSAISRSLVLVDGVPANDAFGDWVYWRSLPPLGIGRIEVVPGGGSALYGNYALGGVVQVISRPITPRTLDAVGDYGSENTGRLSLWASDRYGPIGAAIEGDLLTSDGYYVVAPYDRGPVDTPTPTQHAVINGRVEVEASKNLSVNLRGGYFFENQNGGTAFTTSVVRQGSYSATARYSPGDLGTFDLAVFGHVGEFLQNRALVTAGRSEESLSAHQAVPTNDVGAGLLWTSRSLALAGKHTVTAGVDARWITGHADEMLYPVTVTPSSVVQQNSGGKQQLYGVFAQDVYEVTDAVELVAALRYDSWANTDGTLSQALGSGMNAPMVNYANRTDGQLDPKLGLRVRPLPWLAFRTAAYKAFRAPTLDELYRSFQVGTIKTFGNASLGPETLWGVEAGLDFVLPKGLTLRATGFWNTVDNPIVNVTCPAAPGAPLGTPGTNCIGPNAQKQNLGQANIPGVEASLDWRITAHWYITAAYTFVDSRVSTAPGNPQLVGKQLPQDPSRRANVSAGFDDPTLLTIGAQLNYIGLEYEDALNTLPMAQVFLVNIFAAWHINPTLDVFFGIENLFNTEYLVGRAGVDTVGQPRFIHGGVRLRLGG
jgi:iron complex outermembrane recepter protein